MLAQPGEGQGGGRRKEVPATYSGFHGKGVVLGGPRASCPMLVPRPPAAVLTGPKGRHTQEWPGMKPAWG